MEKSCRWRDTRKLAALVRKKKKIYSLNRVKTGAASFESRVPNGWNLAAGALSSKEE